MTTEQLSERVSVSWKGYGLYEVKITFHGKVYTCHSNNSMAWDDRNWEPGDGPHHYTKKQALQAFWDECCRKNHLGAYNY